MWSRLTFLLGLVVVSLVSSSPVASELVSSVLWPSLSSSLIDSASTIVPASPYSTTTESLVANAATRPRPVDIIPTPASTLSTRYTVHGHLELRGETTIPSTIIGYTSTFGVYSSWNCPTGTFYGVSGFARCCPQTQEDCPVYTACISGSIVANDQFRYTCSGSAGQTVCVTGTIYEFIGDTDPKLFVGCWPSWTGGDWKATRTVSAETSATSTAPPPPPPPGLGPGSIAAITIGAVLGLGIAVAMGVFAARWYYRRRTAQQALGHGVPALAGNGGAPPGPPPPPADPEPVYNPLVPGKQPVVKASSSRHDSVGAESSSSTPPDASSSDGRRPSTVHEVSAVQHGPHEI